MQGRFAIFYVQLAKIFNKQNGFLRATIRKISDQKNSLPPLMGLNRADKALEQNNYGAEL
jgi:hypothetical protein